MQIWERDKPLGISAAESRRGPVARRRRLRPAYPGEETPEAETREPLYRKLFDEVPIGLYIATPNGTIVNVNGELARMLGYPDRQMLLGASVAEMYADAGDWRQAVEALRQPGAMHSAEVKLRTRSGALIVAQDTCHAVHGNGNGLLYYEGSLQDVTEARRLEEQLRQMARHDPLTGVYNRHALAEILVAEAVRSRRYGHAIGMLMVDVDRFKEFNDRFGHAAGDEVLKGIACLITRCVRDSDVVVRYGGDEFLVLLVETDGQAIGVKERIESEMVTEFGNLRYGAPVTVSIGAANWSPESGGSISTLLSRADRAMYVEKSSKPLG
jgi:diguanylate cyclase (GGDEF)-like protein/PAS domain S-box-containing protein